MIIRLAADNGGAADGSFDSTVYTAGTADFVISIPDSMDLFTCDIGALAILCRECSGIRILTYIAISGELFVSYFTRI